MKLVVQYHLLSRSHDAAGSASQDGGWDKNCESTTNNATDRDCFHDGPVYYAQQFSADNLSSNFCTCDEADKVVVGCYSATVWGQKAGISRDVLLDTDYCLLF